MILVGCWTDDAAGALVKALKETAEADAYATSLHQAAEIAVDAARPGLDSATPWPPVAAAREKSGMVEVVSSSEVPLKIVSQQTEDSPGPPKTRKARTKGGGSRIPGT
jgi:hypothetical protein